MQGLDVCISFGARRPDDSIAREILLAVRPLAIEASLMAERETLDQVDERRRAVRLELQQAEYEVKIAARRYHAVDPENCLVASELESRWNSALNKLEECKEKLQKSGELKSSQPPDKELFVNLASDLEAVWQSPHSSHRTRQQLVRTLIEEIIVDVDNDAREVKMLIHWRGGQHSELCIKKPMSGEHTKRTCEDAAKVIRDMAVRWPDEHIAAILNRMGLKTGQALSWTAKRVGSYRRTHHIVGYESAVKDGKCLTMVEAAKKAGVTCHKIRALIKSGVLPARQVVFDAPWQIYAPDLDRPEVQQALHSSPRGRGRPCRNSRDNRTIKIPGI